MPDSDKVLSVETFLDCDDIDQTYFDKPYYLAPADAASHEAFTLIRDGMRATSTAALARTVLFRRLRTVLIRAQDQGLVARTLNLVARTLNFDYEVRSAEEAFDAIPARKIGGEMLELAQHIIETKAGAFEPAAFDDRYEAALAELVKARAEGREPEHPKTTERDDVVDLMEALRQSAGKTRQTSAKKIPARRKKAAASRRKAG